MGKKRGTCECGNERPPGESTCGQCQQMDEGRRKLNAEMRLRHTRETRAAGGQTSS